MRFHYLFVAVAALVAPVGTMLVPFGAVLAQDATIKVNDQLTVPQWVNPEVPGELSGRLILPTSEGASDIVANASLVITDAAGVSTRAKTNESGDFTFKGVKPGVYALAARADGIFACCAMHVVDPKMDSADIYPGTVEIAAAAIDYTIIKTSIIRYLPPTSDEAPSSIADANLRGISSRVVGENNFRVLQDNGGLKGRIHIAGARGSELGDARLLNVFLIADGDVIDHVISNNNGSFEFKNVDPGDYSILAIGQAGLGMAGFELVDESSLVAQMKNPVAADDKTFVSQLADECCCCCSEFSMQVAPLPQAMESMEVVSMGEPVIQDPLASGAAVDAFGNPIDPGMGAVDAFGNPIGGGGFAGGGAGGGYGGGGGGFGGGGGLGGGLGGLASLAGLGALAGLNSGNNNGGGGLTPPGPSTGSVPAP